MTTLNNDQAQFLADYTMLLVRDTVEEKLKALRETDEWKNSIEEGKTDEKVLENILEEKNPIAPTAARK